MELLATLPAGTTVAWVAASADDPTPYAHLGVVGTAVGMARLGNVGARVDGCPCGAEHNLSRYTPVTVVAHDVQPATPTT